MLKQQFFPHRLSHCRAPPSAFATHNTLVLEQQLLQQFIQPDGAGPTTPYPAYTSASNMVAIHVAPMEGIRCTMP